MVHVPPTHAGNGDSSTGWSCATTLPSQDATATSYEAVWRNASRASAFRCASVVPPAAIAAITSS